MWFKAAQSTADHMQLGVPWGCFDVGLLLQLYSYIVMPDGASFKIFSELHKY